MRNGKYSRAEYAVIDLEWFAHDIIQRIQDLRDRQAPDTNAAAKLYLNATVELRKLRQSYEPARPKLRRL